MEENTTNKHEEAPAEFSEKPLPDVPVVERETVPQLTPQAETISSVAEPKAEVVVSVHESADSETTLLGFTLEQFKALLVKILLGCLVAAAVVAVIAVLIGGMTDTVWRSVGTITVAMIHIAILFGVIYIATPHGPGTVQRTTNIVVNASIFIVICSFFTSVLNIWDVFDGTLAWKLYMTYIVALVSLMHYKVLSDAQAVYPKLLPYVSVTYGCIVVVALLILGVVYPDNGFDMLNGFYGRLLAAAVIIDVTLTTIIAVMQHLYLQQHPELHQQVAYKSSAGRTIFITIAVVFGIPMLFWFLSTLFSMMSMSRYQ